MPTAEFKGFKLQDSDIPLLPKLTERQREILTAAGATYADKAESTGFPMGTVRSRLHRARAALTRLREKAPVS